MTEEKLTIAANDLRYNRGIIQSNIKSLTVESFISGVKYAMRWIKVDDELPEIGVKVLVKTKNGSVSVCEMYTPKDCHGTVLGEKEWKGSHSFKSSIIEWRMI